MPIKAVALKDGPYLLTGELGELALTDAGGTPYDLTGKTKIFLCRCGHSETKPFCDGHHKTIGFQAGETAAESDLTA